MTQPAPRQQVRDLIAAKLCDKADYCTECAVQADAVMELFPEVEACRTQRMPGLIIPVPSDARPGWSPAATHTQFALRTTPEPIEEAS